MTRFRMLWLAFPAAAMLAAAACDESPTASPPHRVVTGQPTPTASVRASGDALTGDDADTLVRHMAARWAAQGNTSLQRYVDTAAFWDGPVPRAPAPIQPFRETAQGAPDYSGLRAVVTSASSEPTVNGTQGLVTATAGYIGTDASTTLTYGARFTQQSGTDVPIQKVEFGDGHFQQKLACGAEILAGMAVPPDCMAWTGVVKGAARLSLSHDCGEMVHSSQTTRAWYELPVPMVSLSSGGTVGVQFGWKHFGDSWPLSTAEVSASQPTCPVKVVKEPTCGQQIIFDPSSCDPMNGDPTPMPGQGTGQGECPMYLVRWMITYDGGRTWQVTNSYIETRC